MNKKPAKYYKSTITGRIVLRQDLDILDEIYGENKAWTEVGVGPLTEIDPPSVVDCVLHARNFVAVYRYKELNNCSNKEAFDAIRKMKYKIRKEQKTVSKK